jgi:ribonuclease HI
MRAAAAHQVAWRWVKGHAGHPQNEYANDLATKAAEEQSHSGGAQASAFDTWLAAKRGKGGVRGEIAPFPDGGGFRASPSLPRVE